MTFRAILENNYARKIFGFDTFKDFTSKRKLDNQFKKFEKEAGHPILKDLELLLNAKKFENYELMKVILKKL